MERNVERETVDCPVVFKRIGISKNHGYSLIARGEFPCPVIRAGKRILISKVALTRLLEGKANEAGAQLHNPPKGATLG